MIRMIIILIIIIFSNISYSEVEPEKYYVQIKNESLLLKEKNYLNVITRSSNKIENFHKILNKNQKFDLLSQLIKDNFLSEQEFSQLLDIK